MLDLWPDDLYVGKVRPPVSILREQGQILGQKTRNVVVGVVDDAEAYDSFQYVFILESTVINYRFELLEIRYPIELYPVTLLPGREIQDEIWPDLGDFESKQAEDESEFIEALKAIFASRKVLRIIRAILAHSQDNNTEWESKLRRKDEDERGSGEVSDIPF